MHEWIIDFGRAAGIYSAKEKQLPWKACIALEVLKCVV
jgi:hypothetical protein